MINSSTLLAMAIVSALSACSQPHQSATPKTSTQMQETEAATQSEPRKLTAEDLASNQLDHETVYDFASVGETMSALRLSAHPVRREDIDSTVLTTLTQKLGANADKVEFFEYYGNGNASADMNLISGKEQRRVPHQEIAVEFDPDGMEMSRMRQTTHVETRPDGSRKVRTIQRPIHSNSSLERAQKFRSWQRVLLLMRRDDPVYRLAAGPHDGAPSHVLIGVFP